MKDLISRQRVLKLLSTMPPEEAMTKTLLIQSVKQMDAPDNLVKDSQGLAKELVNDCISRRAAIDIVRFECGEWEGLAKTIIKRFEQLPSAQPERIKGHWVEIASSNHTYKCSVCGRLLVNITDGKNNVAKNYPYCHCGADMRGEQDE